MPIYRNRSKRSGWAGKRYGLLGYTVLWTASVWLAGEPWAVVPTFLIVWPIAEGVQATNDWVRSKIFS